MKRYGHTELGFTESPQGPYVRYEDAAELQRRLDDVVEAAEPVQKMLVGYTELLNAIQKMRKIAKGEEA